MNTPTTNLSIIDSAVSRATIKAAQMILRALNHQLRRKILETILNNKNCLTVSEIYAMLLLEQSVASQHLAILRRAGAVTTQREGKHIFYSVATETIEKIVTLAEDMKTTAKN